MVIRTYIRTVLNEILKKNFVAKVFVNIYYNLRIESPHSVKFSSNLPIIKKEDKKPIFFQSVTGDKIDCK